MNIRKNHGYLTALNSKEDQHFYNIYKKNPDEFMKVCKCEWEEDLTGKYVVSVEQRIEEIQFESDGKYCFNILGIYTPKEDQHAKLKYHGHIAFIDVRGKDKKRISLLYKDDECYPQTLAEWFESEEYNDFNELDLSYYNGEVPTSEDVMRLVEIMIIAESQNPNMKLKIEEEDIIILQGL